MTCLRRLWARQEVKLAVWVAPAAIAFGVSFAIATGTTATDLGVDTHPPPTITETTWPSTPTPTRCSAPTNGDTEANPWAVRWPAPAAAFVHGYARGVQVDAPLRQLCQFPGRSQRRCRRR